jgi:hypothetical protein
MYEQPANKFVLNNQNRLKTCSKLMAEHYTSHLYSLVCKHLTVTIRNLENARIWTVYIYYFLST